MSKFFSFFVLVLFLVLVSSAPSFSQKSFRTLYSFTCNCQPGRCTCRLGDATVEVDTKRSPDRICYEACMVFYGEAIRVNLPFLKVETLEKSQGRATILLNKSLFGKTVLGFEDDKMMQVLKEKLAKASKSKSEKALVDLTTYFVTELAKDASLQKKPNISAVMLTSAYLAPLAKEGKLTDFLSFYFYLRAKHPELLVSSNIEESKKAPLNVFVVYHDPENLNILVSTYISIFKKLVEEYNNTTNLKNIEDNRLVNPLVRARLAGYHWGLDELIPDLIARLSSYIPNYEKNLDKINLIGQELKAVLENIQKR
jgi:hypothetical protein